MDSDRRHIVLIGMMGSGKSTIGRAYAARVGRQFFDTDQMVEANARRPIREIFAGDGEPAFRALETKVLIGALQRQTPSVIAAAGGAVLAAENRAALQVSARVVWLRATPATLAQRVGHRGSRGHRPLIDENPLARITQLVHDRQELYIETADVIIDVDLLNKSNVLDAIDVVLA
jgi:shikimate kinase